MAHFSPDNTGEAPCREPGLGVSVPGKQLWKTAIFPASGNTSLFIFGN